MLVIPIAIGLVLMVVQAGFVLHAQAIIDAAVQEGVLAGTTESGTKQLAYEITESVITDSSETLLADVTINVESDPLQMMITARAKVKSLLPGFEPSISAVASGPREIFIPQAL